MSNLKELASVISVNAALLAESLHADGFPDPSFDQNAPIDFPILEAKGAHARTALVSAATEIIRLALGPADTLRDFYSTVWMSSMSLTSESVTDSHGRSVWKLARSGR